MTFDTVGWIVAGIAVLLTGISKSGLGGAFGGLAVPFMSLWITPGQAAAVMLPLLVFIDWIGIGAYWGKWDRQEIRVLLPAAALGMLVGSLVFGWMPEKAVKGCVGAIAVLFSLDRIFGLRARLKLAGPPGTGMGLFWGALSGFTSTIAHAGSPPLLVYLLNRGLPKGTFVATTVIFFTAVNAVKIVPYVALGLFSWETLKVSLLLAPVAPVGVWIGLKALKRIPERAFHVFATAMLGLSGVKLLWDAFA
ncbi:sulfite exporter TauE/SafE family protein [Aromatoleum evansii]|uniref:sulfite exporter TauE/SafE family protein n=1 Tax=Aromatoleum evansii TaxID=59406 RepID=UPI00145D99E7|nr:sulfite exporter TauE/SafE family protein [Aromatoleum evansii]NMG32332.1 TSUP family transporter [Aromatoleum evansii]